MEDPTQPVDLARFRDRVVQAVEGLEACWQRECLPLELASPDLRAEFGPIAGAYDGFGVPPTDEVMPHRAKWVRSALDEFALALRDAPVRFVSRRQDDGSHRVAVGGDEVAVRGDQAVRARFWGIAFEAGDPGADAHLAAIARESALRRLASELACIGRMCEAILERRIFPGAIHWVPGSVGALFEHLVIDVLNEPERVARHAGLFEDLFEWTDIRVQFPGLARKKGARVQVKLVLREGAGPASIHPRAAAHVLLTPFRLALWVEQAANGEGPAALPDGFWDALGHQPADTNELAHHFYTLFRDAVQSAPEHPLGPMMRLPAVVRGVLRDYVRVESFAMSERMRAALDYVDTVPGWVRRL